MYLLWISTIYILHKTSSNLKTLHVLYIYLYLKYVEIYSCQSFMTECLYLNRKYKL